MTDILETISGPNLCEEKAHDSSSLTENTNLRKCQKKPLFFCFCFGSVCLYLCFTYDHRCGYQ